MISPNKPYRVVFRYHPNMLNRCSPIRQKQKLGTIKFCYYTDIKQFSWFAFFIACKDSRSYIANLDFAKKITDDNRRWCYCYSNALWIEIELKKYLKIFVHCRLFCALVSCRNNLSIYIGKQLYRSFLLRNCICFQFRMFIFHCEKWW